MPWKETIAVEERRTFIDEWLKDKESFEALCAVYGISRKTGYKWVQRYHDGGIANLMDRSRRPHRLVRTVSEEVAEEVVALRKRYPKWGPKKLRVRLVERAPEINWPAESTIGALLKSRGLIPERRRRTRTPHAVQPLAAAMEPNSIWGADFKGAYRVGGKYCHPLTATDLFSRFLLKAKPLEGERFAMVQPVFERMFQEYGMPYRIRTDNGPPFASPKAVAGLSRLSVWWIRLGITPERIEPGHPEQNGRHERMHRTMKAEGVHPGRSRQGEQETLLEEFRVYFNEERPHEAIGQKTPSSVYTSSPREFPKELPDPEYPREFAVRRTSKRGNFSWNGCGLRLGSVLGKEEVGVEPVSDGRWQVWFGPVYLGLIVDKGKKRISLLKNQALKPSE